MTAYAEELFDAVVAGVVSIPTGLALGIRRTYEDVAGSASVRAQNSRERARVMAILRQAAHHGMSDSGPISRLLTHILTEYYDLLPDSMMKALARKAARAGGLAVGHVGGRMAAQTAVTVAVTRNLTAQIVRRTAIKRMVSFGVGAGVSAVLLQGTLEAASNAAKRLRRTHPQLYGVLRAQGLDMAFFLVEKPMRSVLGGIQELRQGARPKALERMCS